MNTIHNIIVKYVLRKYDKSVIARCIYNKIATSCEKSDNKSLTNILDNNIKSFKSKIISKILLSSTTRDYSSVVISHMYNNTHIVKNEDKYFFDQKLSIITTLRLTLASIAFAYLTKSKIMARVFREVISLKEYTAIKLILRHQQCSV